MFAGFWWRHDQGSLAGSDKGNGVIGEDPSYIADADGIRPPTEWKKKRKSVTGVTDNMDEGRKVLQERVSRHLNGFQSRSLCSFVLYGT